MIWRTTVATLVPGFTLSVECLWWFTWHFYALLTSQLFGTSWNYMELLTFPMFLAEGCWRWVTIFPGWSMTSHGPMTQMRQDCLYLRSLHGCGGAAPLSCGCVLPAACRLIDSEGPYEHVPPMGPRSCTIRVNYSDLTATSLELWIRIRIEVTIPKWPYFELMNYHFIRFYCHCLSSIKIYQDLLCVSWDVRAWNLRHMRDREQNTPLLLAAQSGHTRIIEALLRRNAEAQL